MSFSATRRSLTYTPTNKHGFHFSSIKAISLPTVLPTWQVQVFWLLQTPSRQNTLHSLLPYLFRRAHPTNSVLLSFLSELESSVDFLHKLLTVEKKTLSYLSKTLNDSTSSLGKLLTFTFPLRKYDHCVSILVKNCKNNQFLFDKSIFQIF